MKKMVSLGIAVSLLTAACAAYAYPSLAGYTGMGALPTADIVPTGQFQVAADYYNTDDETLLVNTENNFPVRVLFGATEDFEIGAGYSFLQVNDDDANTWNVNAKYLTPLTPLGFDWSLGARYSSTDLSGINDTLTSTMLYFVGTRDFSVDEGEGSPQILGTVGVNWAQLDSDIAESDDGFRFFFGGEFLFANNVSLAAEYQFESDIDDEGLYSLVGRYAFNNATAVELGYTNADPLTHITGTDDGNFFAGVNFAFGTEDDEF